NSMLPHRVCQYFSTNASPWSSISVGAKAAHWAVNTGRLSSTKLLTILLDHSSLCPLLALSVFCEGCSVSVSSVVKPFSFLLPQLVHHHGHTKNKGDSV